MESIPQRMCGTEQEGDSPAPALGARRCRGALLNSHLLILTVRYYVFLPKVRKQNLIKWIKLPHVL